MSSKVLLGLVVSAVVGMGATAAFADEKGYYGYQMAVKVVPPVVIKDNLGKMDDVCKVPLVEKYGKYPEEFKLITDDGKVKTQTFRKGWKEYTIVKCNFKDKGKFDHYKDLVEKGFLCKFTPAPVKNRYGKYEVQETLNTNYSVVKIDFDEANKGKKNPVQKIVAEVKLQCTFVKDLRYGGHKPHPKPTY